MTFNGNLTSLNEDIIKLAKGERPVLELEIKPGMYSDSQKLTFHWKAVSFKNNVLFLQLYFDFPEYV